MGKDVIVACDFPSRDDVMNFLDKFIQVDVKKHMGIVGVTDEFFCVYLYSSLGGRYVSIYLMLPFMRHTPVPAGSRMLSPFLI